ncbi:MAG: hypothetical protein AAGI30_05110 [Planctomycetota bacterium]
MGSEATCNAVGGTFLGLGTDCSNDSCEVLIGACCLTARDCLDGYLELDCMAAGGHFAGPSVTCSQGPCLNLQGACCLGPDDDDCRSIRTFIQCEATEGVFLGPNGDCATTDCGSFVGGCCTSESVCTDGVFEAECELVGGQFLGIAVPCVANGCMDCNLNLVPDAADIAGGLSSDTNGDGVPDVCQDCNGNDINDVVELAQGLTPDCNNNDVPDECDIGQASTDFNSDGIPDECQDCNINDLPDSIDIASGTSQDEDTDGVPDECQGCPAGACFEGNQFQSGFAINLMRNVHGDLVVPLQRNVLPVPLDFINVAASDRDTIVRINTRTGEIVGEYPSKPDGRAGNPSRTTVDLDGRVWAGNRSETQSGLGSVVQIGLVVGGLRTNASGQLDPEGLFLAPPYEFNTCVDRDGDGLIRTSTGLGDILPWSNIGGADDAGGVSTALDECLLKYVRVQSTGTRHLSLNHDNNIWVCGTGDEDFELVSGETGDIVQTFNAPVAMGYGGLTDCNGIVWSVDNGAGPNLLLHDTRGTSNPNDDSQTIISGDRTYGLGIDLEGDIWVSMWNDDAVQAFDALGTRIVDPTPTQGGSSDRGVAVTLDDNHIWVANSGGDSVSRLDNDGNLLKVISLGPDGRVPTGVAVDAEGMVWVTNQGSNTVKKIDPHADTDGLGAVIDTINLGADAGPYNYSDMTGYVGLQTTGAATWTEVVDGGIFNGMWQAIRWNETCAAAIEPEPAGTSIEVCVRAGNRVAELADRPWIPVTNGVPLGGVAGRFVEIRARLIGSCTSDPYASPVLCDLTLEPDEARCDCVCEGTVDCDGDLDCDGVVTVQDFIAMLVNFGNASDPQDRRLSGDFDCDGLVDANDFIEVLVNFGSSCL